MTVGRVEARQSTVQNLAPTRQDVFLVDVTSELEESPQSTTNDFFLCAQYLNRVKHYAVQGCEETYRRCIFGLDSNSLGSESSIVQALHRIC